MRHSSESHNVARLRVFLGQKQPEFAKLIGCSVHTLQSIETKRLELSEPLAWRISAATGVHFRWLVDNDLSTDIGGFGRRYSKSEFERLQANKKVGSSEFVQYLAGDYAASFYGQIRCVLSSAIKRDLADVAIWKLAKFLEDCRAEFGHDTQLIESKEQFGLRADYSPHLKFRQVEAGISLFRRYDQERTRSIRQSLAQLKKARAKKRSGKRQRAGNRPFIT